MVQKPKQLKRIASFPSIESKKSPVEKTKRFFDEKIKSSPTRRSDPDLSQSKVKTKVVDSKTKAELLRRKSYESLEMVNGKTRETKAQTASQKALKVL